MVIVPVLILIRSPLKSRNHYVSYLGLDVFSATSTAVQPRRPLLWRPSIYMYIHVLA